MFGWFARWRENRQRKKERLIFKYWAGNVWKYGDPFTIWRKIMNHSKFNLETHGPMVDEGQEPETGYCLDCLCEAFDIQRWNSKTQTGLTDWEIIGLLDMLRAYMEFVKKKYSHGPTSQEPTDLESSTSPEPPPETTKPSLASTS